MNTYLMTATRLYGEYVGGLWCTTDVESIVEVVYAQTSDKALELFYGRYPESVLEAEPRCTLLCRNVQAEEGFACEHEQNRIAGLLDWQFDAEVDENLWDNFLQRLTDVEFNLKTALDNSPEWVRIWFAWHSISATLLHMLASDSSVSVRRFVADNACTTPLDLDKLADDTDVVVRSNVALSINVSQSTLTRLVQDRSSRVRRAVALHPRATSAMLSLLAQDDNPMVRCSVASHPSTDLSTLSALCRDANSSVVQAAREALNARRAKGETR